MRYVKLVLTTVAVLVAVGLAWWVGVSTAQGSGVVALQSPYSFEVTLERLENVIADRGLTLMTTIDHTANAKKVDQVLRPTRVLLFGNPAVGTPLIQCNQRIAIDLPQKALVWEDAEGQVWVGYNDPFVLGLKHAALSECFKILENINNALSGIFQSVVAR